MSNPPPNTPVSDFPSAAIRETELPQQTGDLVIPVIEERLHVETRLVERVGVRLNKLVRERTETVDVPLMEEHTDIERVVIDRVVEIAPSVRYEGDVMIIPLLEEVLVTEKRLVLREELHVRKRTVTARRPQPVVLRREEMEIERVAHDPPVVSRKEPEQS